MLGVEVEFKRSKYFKLFPAELRGEADFEIRTGTLAKDIQNTPKLSPRCRIQLKNIRYQLKSSVNDQVYILESASVKSVVL